jgi:hypothetical protein
MIDDFYQAAFEALRHHLDEAAAPYSVDEGELLLDSHRLGLSVTFEGFVAQGERVLAPLDIQIHVDGDNGDRFRVGTLGIGANQQSALRDAVFEWHLLAAAPLLAALGAPLENRRAAAHPQQLAGWDLFVGRVGIRGTVPPELRAGGSFYRALVDRLRPIVAQWEMPDRFALRSMYVMTTRTSDACEVQAAVDGMLNEELVALLGSLPWPGGDEAYLYKQLFVLRHQPGE